jgi:hypothetical protein
MSLEDVLRAADNTGSNTSSNILNRKQLREMIVEIYGVSGSEWLTYAFKEGYIREGRLWGFIMTKKGYEKLFELQEERMINNVKEDE